ncbi:MAG: hypothetical protein ACRECV_00825 [Xanthobacteraceae bacterium]
MLKRFTVAAPAAEPAAAATYSDLLQPVPNALHALKADDAARAKESPTLQEAQFVVRPPYWHRRFYHHHHITTTTMVSFLYSAMRVGGVV